MDTNELISGNSPRQSPAAEAPEWVLEYVAAALRTGLKVPEIEDALKKKGLVAALAPAVVDRCLELQLQDIQRKERRARFWKWLNRASSLAVAAAALIAASFSPERLAVAKCLIGMILPMTCIWFPDFADSKGSYVGRISLLGSEYRPTPSIFVLIAGWILLVVVACRFAGLFNEFI